MWSFLQNMFSRISGNENGNNSESSEMDITADQNTSSSPPEMELSTENNHSFAIDIVDIGDEVHSNPLSDEQFFNQDHTDMDMVTIEVRTVENRTPTISSTSDHLDSVEDNLLIDTDNTNDSIIEINMTDSDGSSELESLSEKSTPTTKNTSSTNDKIVIQTNLTVSDIGQSEIESLSENFISSSTTSDDNVIQTNMNDSNTGPPEKESVSKNSVPTTKTASTINDNFVQTILTDFDTNPPEFKPLSENSISTTENLPTTNFEQENALDHSIIDPLVGNENLINYEEFVGKDNENQVLALVDGESYFSVDNGLSDRMHFAVANSPSENISSKNTFDDNLLEICGSDVRSSSVNKSNNQAHRESPVNSQGMDLAVKVRPSENISSKNDFEENPLESCGSDVRRSSVNKSNIQAHLESPVNSQAINLTVTVSPSENISKNAFDGNPLESYGSNVRSPSVNKPNVEAHRESPENYQGMDLAVKVSPSENISSKNDFEENPLESCGSDVRSSSVNKSNIQAHCESSVNSQSMDLTITVSPSENISSKNAFEDNPLESCGSDVRSLSVNKPSMEAHRESLANSQSMDLAVKVSPSENITSKNDFEDNPLESCGSDVPSVNKPNIEAHHIPPVNSQRMDLALTVSPSENISSKNDFEENPSENCDSDVRSPSVNKSIIEAYRESPVNSQNMDLVVTVRPSENLSKNAFEDSPLEGCRSDIRSLSVKRDNIEYHRESPVNAQRKTSDNTGTCTSQGKKSNTVGSFASNNLRSDVFDYSTEKIKLLEKSNSSEYRHCLSTSAGMPLDKAHRGEKRSSTENYRENKLQYFLESPPKKRLKQTNICSYKTPVPTSTSYKHMFAKPQSSAPVTVQSSVNSKKIYYNLTANIQLQGKDRNFQRGIEYNPNTPKKSLVKEISTYHKNRPLISSTIETSAEVHINSSSSAKNCSSYILLKSTNSSVARQLAKPFNSAVKEKKGISCTPTENTTSQITTCFNKSVKPTYTETNHIYTKEPQLKNNRKTINIDGSSEVFCCFLCKKTFGNNMAILSHIRNHNRETSAKRIVSNSNVDIRESNPKNSALEVPPGGSFQNDETIVSPPFQNINYPTPQCKNMSNSGSSFICRVTPRAFVFRVETRTPSQNRKRKRVETVTITEEKVPIEIQNSYTNQSVSITSKRVVGNSASGHMTTDQSTRSANLSAPDLTGTNDVDESSETDKISSKTFLNSNSEASSSSNPSREKYTQNQANSQHRSTISNGALPKKRHITKSTDFTGRNCVYATSLMPPKNVSRSSEMNKNSSKTFANSNTEASSNNNNPRKKGLPNKANYDHGHRATNSNGVSSKKGHSVKSADFIKNNFRNGVSETSTVPSRNMYISSEMDKTSSKIFANSISEASSRNNSSTKNDILVEANSELKTKASNDVFSKKVHRVEWTKQFPSPVIKIILDKNAKNERKSQKKTAEYFTKKKTSNSTRRNYSNKDTTSSLSDTPSHSRPSASRESTNTNDTPENSTIRLTCESCQRTVANKTMLELHRIFHISLDITTSSQQQTPTPQQIKCYECQKSFESISAHNLHALSYQEKYYRCVECLVEFKDRPYHTWSLDPGKNILCPNCRDTGEPSERQISDREARYLNYSSTKHFMYNYADVIHDCEICGKAFYIESLFQRHLFEHIDMVLHCRVCDREFERVDQFKSHILTHTI